MSAPPFVHNTYDTNVDAVVDAHVQALIPAITALTGDVTATGPGSAVATIAAHAVTYGKMQQASTKTLIGNPTLGTADVTEVTADAPLYLSEFTGTLFLAISSNMSFAASGPITVLDVNRAFADGATLGIACFKAADFNDNGAGLISIDYANGQVATAIVNGFLKATDWSTFNGKQPLVSWLDVTAGSSKISLGGTPTGSVFHAFSIDVSEANLTLSNMGGTLGVTHGGTGTSTAFTQGSVVFAGASGIYSQSNANFFYDTSNNRVGIHQTSPTAYLHLGAGTASASTAPLKLTSGTLLTTAEAGAVEFLTDKFYGAITTGAARKEFTLNDAALTSGQLTQITTNGRLTNASMWWDEAGARLSIGGAGNFAYTLSVFGSNPAQGCVNNAVNRASIFALCTSSNHFITGDITDDTLFFSSNGNLLLVAAGAQVIKWSTTGRMSFGGPSVPSVGTAVVHLPAGAAAAGSAPLKLTSGTNLTTAEAGAVEYNGTNLFFTRSGTTRENVITASAVTTEVLISDTSVTININGTTYKLLAKA